MAHVKKRNAYRFWWGSLNERFHMEDQTQIGERVMLLWNLRKQN
jgi:hypothetical protein